MPIAQEEIRSPADVPEQPPTTNQTHSETPIAPPAAAPGKRPPRHWITIAAILVGVVASGYFLVPWLQTTLNTVHTDDAYVNGHVTYVAPRVSGQVKKVFVSDNNRVKKGDLLIQLDKEPFELQVALKRAALDTAEANVAAAEAKVRGIEAELGTQRWKLQNAMEQVDSQIAQLRLQAAALAANQATLERTQADMERGKEMFAKSALSADEFDLRKQQLRVAEANVRQAQEAIAQTRVGLGLSPQPEPGKAVTDVPPNLNQTYSAVRASLTACTQLMAQLGLPLPSTEVTPDEALKQFQRLNAQGNLDELLHELVPKAPAVLLAKADLEQARSDLALAELNLRYCDVVSEIDGVVTSKNVNPGNNVQANQAVMSIRSLTEIWIDANFKETQLADLRIGQRVRCEVDMYGGRREFEGRITGFTMGTGQTLALLPPQNATGNFVKIVQRLPVRIELTDYNPDEAPLFVGLSVEPFVYFKEPPTGPNAGEYLQPHTAPPTGETRS